jgi:histone H3/H4
MSHLPASKVKKLVVEGGEGIRISAEAVTAAIEAGATILTRIGNRAASIARSKQRKTIMPEDIQEAYKQLWPY